MNNINKLIEKAKENAIKFTKEDTKKSVNIYVHVLIYKEEELYLAHCLEFDIVAEGYSKEEAKKNIGMAIINHVIFNVRKGNIDKIMNPAPDEYWNNFFPEASGRKGKATAFRKKCRRSVINVNILTPSRSFGRKGGYKLKRRESDVYE